MSIFKIVILVCNIIVLIPSLYFGLFFILLFLKKTKDGKFIKKKKHNKFLILIAARNEEMVIGHLIDSVNMQKYNRKFYDICVLPNNCSDKTKEIAKEKKAIIVDIDFNPKTKGEVLNYAFDYFKNNQEYDAYVIVDADNVLDPLFLKHIDDKLNQGYKIVQGFRDTKNLYENAITGSYGLFFLLQNLFIYEPRSRINQSIGINGTGYAILKSLVDKINYRAKTSTEDIELTCICALEKEKIGYEKKAIFYDEQVTNFNISMIQRKRWIQGSMQVLKLNIKKLIKSWLYFQAIDEIFALIFPIDQAIAFLLLLLSYFFIKVPYIILGIIIGYFGEVIVALFLTIYFKKNIKKMLKAIFFFPIFHLSWIPIYIYSCFNSKNNWEEIKHTKARNIQEVLND